MNPAKHLAFHREHPLWTWTFCTICPLKPYVLHRSGSCDLFGSYICILEFRETWLHDASLWDCSVLLVDAWACKLQLTAWQAIEKKMELLHDWLERGENHKTKRLKNSISQTNTDCSMYSMWPSGSMFGIWMKLGSLQCFFMILWLGPLAPRALKNWSARVPTRPQTMVVSRTLTSRVETLLSRYQRPLGIDLIPDDSCKIAMSQVEDVEETWDFRTFGIHKVEAMRHLRTLPTVPAMSHGDVCRPSADLRIWLNVINVTEHSSLPSLPTPFAKWLLLSSPCRMEIAPGFSPWGLAMGHCGTSCLVLNFPINSFNQHLFAWAGRCRERCHAARSQIGRCS